MAAFFALVPSVHRFDDLRSIGVLPVLVVVLALGPAIGTVILIQQGPLVIDHVAETLTYQRRVMPFAKLGLVRIRTTQTLVTHTRSDGGPRSKTVDVEVVSSGAFCLSPEDRLSRRCREKLANHLNDTLAAYYRRIGQPLDPVPNHPPEQCIAPDGSPAA